MPGLHPRSYARLVIAAPQGRSGKTTVSLGLCAALAARGLSVQPFKKGPDYIDPSWLSAASQTACRTLDPFFYLTPSELQRAFRHGARQSHIALIEGNHGLYDSALSTHGRQDKAVAEDSSGSTAALARLLQAPIILVVNAARMSRSAAAMVMGCQLFEPDTPIRAVILNNVANSRHESKLRLAIESHCRIPVVGALPRDEALSIPDRHLGLVPQGEQAGLTPALSACRQAAEQYLDLDQVLSIAQSAPPLDAPDLAWQEQSHTETTPEIRRPRLGVLRDRAFSFYYPENLEALEQAGAELVFIDSFTSSGLPDLHALYIGGGFPEMFMEELSENRALRQDIRAAAEAGLPMYAECGGLMYLSRRLRWGERAADMVGVLPCEVELASRPQGHGYVLAETSGHDPFFPAGSLLRGHEFHHSRVTGLEASSTPAYRLLKGSGIGGDVDGLVTGNVLAAYTHLHAAGSPDWASGLVSRAAAYAEGQPHG